MQQNTTTNSFELRNRIIAILEGLLNDHENDIETGIAEGIYDKKENVETRNQIKESRAALEEFKTDIPEIFVFVSGGLVQGISASTPMRVMVLDQDNYEGCETVEETDAFIESFGHPDSWEDMLDQRAKAGELMPVF